MSKWENNEEIKIFQEYLRIPTVHPDVDYEPCIEFLKKQADGLGLPVKIYYPGGPKKPILVMTLVGTQPELPSVVLNSHTDVVPVFPENWTHPPFGAEIDEEGKIYARGSQDMKCVGMQYLAALRALKKDGVSFKRTIHVVYVPDEEIGGKLGMALFVHTDEFKELNVGVSLDEGAPWPSPVSPLFYGERTTWQIHFKFHGQAGHGCIIHKNTAAEKFHYVVSKFLEYRDKEAKRLAENSKTMFMGDGTSVNLTKIQGGVQVNVVPSLIEAWFDCRVAVDVDMDKFQETIENWCKEAGDNVEIIWEQKQKFIPPTKIDDTNKFWVALKKSFQELNIKVDPQICPGGTDSKYLRSVGVPAFGYSPMPNTKILIHDNDECLPADTYLQGIQNYIKIIQNIANVD